MNGRLIVFSAIVTAGVGAVLGIGVSQVAGTKYVSQAYRNLEPLYIMIGAGAGLVAGASQESIRQLKRQRDLEEKLEAIVQSQRRIV